MSPITIELNKVDFAPTGQRETPRLSYGVFIFALSIEYENELHLESWSITDASFTDSLNRDWALLDGLCIRQLISSLPNNIQISFELENLIEDAALLVENSCLRVELASGSGREYWQFDIFHKGFPYSLDWISKREAVSDNE